MHVSRFLVHRNLLILERRFCRCCHLRLRGTATANATGRPSLPSTAAHKAMRSLCSDRPLLRSRHRFSLNSRNQRFCQGQLISPLGQVPGDIRQLLLHAIHSRRQDHEYIVWWRLNRRSLMEYKGEHSIEGKLCMRSDNFT